MTVAFEWLGLGRGLGAAGCLLVAIGIFAVQCGLSWAWLQRFQYGPLEWLWRCATYAEMIGIRRPSRAPAPRGDRWTRRLEACVRSASRATQAGYASPR